jgi:hypothetical protein
MKGRFAAPIWLLHREKRRKVDLERDIFLADNSAQVPAGQPDKPAANQ